jgi:uncharacterized protein (DUF1810 family)
VSGEGLDRFVAASSATHAAACAELRAGAKRTHWMWWTFPQVAGLGRSHTARRYAVEGYDEARAFLAHPVLAARLAEAMAAMMANASAAPEAVLGDVDAAKLRSSMTLFEAVADDPAPFAEMIATFHGAARCARTLDLLQLH